VKSQAVSFGRRRTIAFATLTTVLLLVLATTAALAGGRPLEATLLGANEVPGPGDPDGSGHADVTLNQGQGEVCFDITVQDIDPVTNAHIHVGAAGVSGPVVVGFNPAVNGLSGCVPADAELIKTIRKNPAGYYVNVHTSTFPGGAVRGQLEIPE
jgi:hypothetical protein